MVSARHAEYNVSKPTVIGLMLPAAGRDYYHRALDIVIPVNPAPNRIAR